jgi:3'-5' exoribonuclease
MDANPFQPAHLLDRTAPSLAGLEPGRSYEKIRCVVHEVRTDTFRKGANAGKPYLSLIVGDASGRRLDLKCCDGAALAERLAAGTVIELASVDIDQFNGAVNGKFQPAALRVLTAGEYNPADFVPSLPREQIEANWRELQERLDQIENPDLVRLREAVFGDAAIADAYKVHPSAVRHHHNYLGGNVQHVLGMLRIVDAVCAGYRDIDRDVAAMGVVLHDLGKLKEYTYDTTIRVTDEGRLRGHLVIGAEWLGRICAELRVRGAGIPKPLEDHLVHIILSHHRKGEWGSPKPPATPEAMLVHLADYADSQTQGFLQAVEEGQDAPDGWSYRKDGENSQWIRVRDLE